MTLDLLYQGVGLVSRISYRRSLLSEEKNLRPDLGPLTGSELEMLIPGSPAFPGAPLSPCSPFSPCAPLGPKKV